MAGQGQTQNEMVPEFLVATMPSLSRLTSQEEMLRLPAVAVQNSAAAAGAGVDAGSGWRSGIAELGACACYFRTSKVPSLNRGHPSILPEHDEGLLKGVLVPIQECQQFAQTV